MFALQLWHHELLRLRLRFLSSRSPAEDAGQPPLLVSVTPLWGGIVHWETNLMCVNGVLGDTFQLSHEIPLLLGSEAGKSLNSSVVVGLLKEPDSLVTIKKLIGALGWAWLLSV